MDEGDYHDEDHEGDDPALAFERLRGEVALLRRAVESLASARQSIEVPDYQPTLERTEKVLASLTQQVEGVRKSPALAMTPEAFGQRMHSVTGQVAVDLGRLLQDPKAALEEAVRDLRWAVGTVRDVQKQRLWVRVAGAAGVLAGIGLYALLAGPIAQSMPDNWRWPEKMALRALGESNQWQAGARLMQQADPASWRAVALSAPLAKGNRTTIENCSKTAAKAGKPVPCTIKVMSLADATADPPDAMPPD